MKNNRKIKVGQVREIIAEKIQYVILLNPQDSNMTKVMILSGKEKGEIMYWRRLSLDEDIVVM